MREITYEEFKNIKNKGKIIAAFGAPWCRDCIFIQPILQQLSSEFSEIDFVHINVDNCEHARQELAIRHIPTIFFLKDGEEIAERVVEPKSKEALLAEIAKF